MSDAGDYQLFYASFKSSVQALLEGDDGLRKMHMLDVIAGIHAENRLLEELKRQREKATKMVVFAVTTPDVVEETE